MMSPTEFVGSLRKTKISNEMRGEDFVSSPLFLRKENIMQQTVCDFPGCKMNSTAMPKELFTNVVISVSTRFTGRKQFDLCAKHTEVLGVVPIDIMPTVDGSLLKALIEFIQETCGK